VRNASTAKAVATLAEHWSYSPMRVRPSSRLLGLWILFLLALGAWISRRSTMHRHPLPVSPRVATTLEMTTGEEPLPSPAALPRTSPEERSSLVADKLLARLKKPQALEKAKAGEAVLSFTDAEAFHRFLQRAAASGFRVLGRLDRLNALQIGYDSLDALSADIGDHPGDYANLDPNLVVYPPGAPPIEERMAGRFAPIGDNLLQFLGVTGDTSKWGAGVTIAVLDSGVSADATFGTGRLRFLDVGLGISPLEGEGHGTAVAGLAAGMASDAPGTAPSANVLSIRVTGADGLSDSFTLARAIVAAVDAGVPIVNISLGSYANTFAMANAIDYAGSHGVVLVASAGNDQAAQLTWPAADPRVVSVGAVDASEQQVTFSNSGDHLSLTAPGFGVQAAWLNGQRVTIDGTSASSPIVAGAIAAVMSQNPGLTGTQAWQLLQRYASDGGVAGPDPDYGHGILNLGWAMNRGDFNRIDTAVSSLVLAAGAAEMQFVVQNRSASPVGGLTLKVNASGHDLSYPVPWLGPGGIYTVSVPVDIATLHANGRIDYRTTLVNPPSLVDAVPSNNHRANSISLTQSK
jgi:Subtilase family